MSNTVSNDFPLDSFLESSRDFFDRDVLEVAPEILGTVLIRHTDAGTVGIRITEVEAYAGERDPGAHTFRGKTERNKTMFGEPGHIYCYFTYGLHHAINLVCAEKDKPYGCLIRAGEVVIGQDLARSRREAKPRKHPLPEFGLARGPGNVAETFDATLNNDGDDLFSDNAHAGRWQFLIPQTSEAGQKDFFTGARIGVNGPGGDPKNYPWRFWLPNERTVSANRLPK